MFCQKHASTRIGRATKGNRNGETTIPVNTVHPTMSAHSLIRKLTSAMGGTHGHSPTIRLILDPF
jgi:hypothetical protein